MASESSPFKTLEQLTVDELPQGAPEWLGKILASLKLADHLGDAWDAVIYDAPPQWREWIKSVASAEYDEDEGAYYVG